AVVPRLSVGCEAPGEDRDDRERDGEVREPAPGALEILLVAQLGEPSLVFLELDRPRHMPSPGRSPASTCWLPRRGSAMIRIAATASRCSRHCSSRACWPFDHASTSGGCAM